MILITKVLLYQFYHFDVYEPKAIFLNLYITEAHYIPIDYLIVIPTYS